jgi:hypothetical protein
MDVTDGVNFNPNDGIDFNPGFDWHHYAIMPASQFRLSNEDRHHKDTILRTISPASRRRIQRELPVLLNRLSVRQTLKNSQEQLSTA